MVNRMDVLSGWLTEGNRPGRERPAIEHAQNRQPSLTGSGLVGAVEAIDNDLAAHGAGPGDRVILWDEPGPAWLAAWLGALRRGCVTVPLDSRLTDAEARSLIDRSQVTAAVTGPTFASRWAAAGHRPAILAWEHVSAAAGTGPTIESNQSAEPGQLPESPGALEVAAADPVTLVWTSGTTGAPRGVLLSGLNLAYVVEQVATGQTLSASDRWLSVLPPNHLLELVCGLLPALSTGASTIVAGTLMPGDLVTMVAEKAITHMVVVPAVLAGLAKYLQAGSADATADGRLSSLKAVYCGGAALDPGIALAMERVGVVVYPGYGLTETSPVVAMCAPGSIRYGSVGRPLAGTEVRLRAPDRQAAGAPTDDPATAAEVIRAEADHPGEGELCVRGPGVMLGYWNDPEATANAIDTQGWLGTGDLATIDPQGFITITGRVSVRIVLISGKKVDPTEVENALTADGTFAEACVLAWPPPARPGVGGGGRGGAAKSVEVIGIVRPSGDYLLAGTGPVSRPVPGTSVVATGPAEWATEVATGLVGRLSPYKRPHRILVHPGPLPRTAKGTVRRGEVAAWLARTLDPAVQEHHEAGDPTTTRIDDTSRHRIVDTASGSSGTAG
ncbi:MAG: class I adenylate-forming enzyme family protein [Acidimicrobiales bacterium]